MNQFMNIMNTIKWMLLFAVIIAILLLFINPMYAIIFTLSGIMGFIIGLNCVTALIPEDFDTFKNELETELDKLIEKAKNNNINV